MTLVFTWEINNDQDAEKAIKQILNLMNLEKNAFGNKTLEVFEELEEDKSELLN